MDAQELIRQESEATEARRHEPLPVDVVGERRNVPPRVLSVRLSGEQFDELSAEAESAGIPVSTLARVLIVRGLTERSAQRPAQEGLSEVAEYLQTLIRSLEPQVQHVVRESVHAELTKVVRPEFLREAV